ncbi:MAG: cytochrome P450 [Hyphomicrobiaceae bacterium]
MTRQTTYSAPSRLYPPTVTPPDQPLPLAKYCLTFIKNPLQAIPRQVYEQPIVTYRPAPNTTIVWVTDPPLIESILRDKDGRFEKSPLEKRAFQRTVRQSLLTAEGTDWRWQRHAIAPLFRLTEIAGYVPAMLAAAQDLIKDWHSHPPEALRRIDKDMTDVTFSVIARTMLKGGEPSQSLAIKQAGEAYLSSIPWEMIWALLQMPQWLPHLATWKLNRKSQAMRRAVATVVAQHPSSDPSKDDLMARLKAARHPDTGETMDTNLLVDNLLTLLIAGHETTAKALAWTLYLLARAPDWQEAVRHEINCVTHGSQISEEHLGQLHITSRVIKESMRLYPPAPVLARQPLETIELAGNRIPSKAQVVIPIFCVHRHRRLWDDPDLFNPDRFLPAQSGHISRTQYMPFGAGLRTCVGMSFAMVEATALLAAFIQNAEFSWDGQHTPEPISRITLRSKGGMPLFVRTI